MLGPPPPYLPSPKPNSVPHTPTYLLAASWSRSLRSSIFLCSWRSQGWPLHRALVNCVTMHAHLCLSGPIYARSCPSLTISASHASLSICACLDQPMPGSASLVEGWGVASMPDWV